MGALHVPVDEHSDPAEAHNRLVFRDSGAVGYGQQIRWTDYDGVEKDRRTGVVASTGNHTLKIRNTAGMHILVRNAADAADVLKLEDGGLTVGVGLSATGNASVGGTLGVTGTITGSSTVQGTRLISTVATGTAPLVVASSTQVANLNVSSLQSKVPGTGVDNLAFYDGSGQVADSAKLAGVAGSGYLLKTGGTIGGALTVTGTLTPQGTLAHTGSSIGFFSSAPNTRQTVTGSRGANAALTNLLSALANYGLITDSST